jgi:hypothetical protein
VILYKIVYREGRGRISAHQRQRVAKEDESRGMVGEVVGYFVEGGVYSLVVVLADLVRVFIN